MTSEPPFDPASFKGLEYAGWQKNSASYDALLGSVTRHAIEPLLDATGVGAGTDLLDVCCGHGSAAGAAVARGARALGVDFAPAMVKAARQRFPGARFRCGDAEHLRFPDETFDVVICAFGVNHLALPEKAMAEALRDTGFVDARVGEIDLAFRPQAPQPVLDLAYSAVRLEMILSAQTEPARAQIHQAIIDAAERFRHGGVIEIAMPAVLAVARKPK